MSMFNQCLERGSKRISHMTRDELVKNHPRSSLVPLVDLHSPQRFIQECDQEFDSSYPRGNKRKRIKVYHSLPMTYKKLLPVLIQNYGIPIIPVRLRRSPYPKKYDVNAKCEYHGGVGGHSIEDCTTFKDKVQVLIDANSTKFRELVNGHQKF